MTVQCPASDAPAEAAAPIACLGAPSPNPVIDELRFGVELTRAGPVRVLVHDATGALVATLVDRELPAGRHAQSWHPVNARGDRLANGIYFLRLEAPGVRQRVRSLLHPIGVALPVDGRIENGRVG